MRRLLPYFDSFSWLEGVESAAPGGMGHEMTRRVEFREMDEEANRTGEGG